jgi:transcriptional regulator with XRE-family HTH domain
MVHLYSVRVKAGALRHQMRVRGLTATELAELAGVSRATVSHAMNGRRIHPRKLRAIAAALGAVPLIPGIEALAEGA